jgi:predicted TIM-barrel fold metal-dependent hydrolase
VPDKHLSSHDVANKTIDIHTHAGISLKSFAQLEFPYASTVEDIYYRQVVNGVDCSVVFPINANLYFDQAVYLETGRLTPAQKPISPAPYESENRMLLTEVYTFCPERAGHFLPFVSADPGRAIADQVRSLRNMAREYPIYGLKIAPVACQSPVTELLKVGHPILELAEEMDWPILFHVTTDPAERFSQASDTLDIVERRQKLRFSLAHCIGLHREFLQRAAALPNCWVDTAALKIQVQLAHERNPLMALPPDRFPCDCSDHKSVMTSLVEAFPTKILWGSDAPYHSYIVRRLQAEGTFRDFRLKGTYEEEKAALDTLSPQQRAQMMRNAIAFIFGTRP